MTDTLTTTRKHEVHKFIFPRMFSSHWRLRANTFLEKYILCAPCFLVCARLTTCVRAHTRTA